jgi:phage tail sheath protein FI
MPEYLAPGVYVEEVDTGSKPIEGVSTSTAGMVGVTERGPVGVPVLITSYGEFQRWFGSQLNAADYPNHCYFPHAIEGFFTNGGKRVYVVRALNASASKALGAIFDRGDVASVATRLVRATAEHTGTAATPPGILVLDPGAISDGDWIRVGDGSASEYRQVDGNPAQDATMVVSQLPLSHSVPNTAKVQQIVRTTTGGPFTLQGNASWGDTSIVVQGATADVAALNVAVGAGNCCIEIGGVFGELRLITEATQQTVAGGGNSTLRLQLDAGLQMAHPTQDPIAQISLDPLAVIPIDTANVDSGIAGGAFLFVDDRNGNFDVQANLLHILDGATTIEVKRIGDLRQFDLAPGCYTDLSAGGRVEAVSLSQRTVNVGGSATALVLDAGETAGLVVGQQVIFDPAVAPVTVTIQSIDAQTNTITVSPALAAAPAAATPLSPASKVLTAAVASGGKVLALDNRMGIQHGATLQVGSGGAAEIVTAAALPAESSTAPNAGNVVVSPALRGGFANGAPVQIVSVAPVANRQICVIALGASRGDGQIVVSDGTGFAALDLIRITSASGVSTFHTLVGVTAAPITPQTLNLSGVLNRAHPAGSPVVQRAPLFDVEALDAGIWGNRIRLSIQDVKGLANAKTIQTTASTIHVDSPAGIEAGTVLEFFDANTGVALAPPLKVANINRAANNAITIQGGLPGPLRQNGLGVRSLEFNLIVTLLRQPDPTTPTRDDQMIDGEEYKNLSLDPRHSRYIGTAIGSIDGALRLWDRRPEGPSLYIRVRDRAADRPTAEALRQNPEALTDNVRGRSIPAKHPLDQRTVGDAIDSLLEEDYRGVDSDDPHDRTGLNSLRNIEDVSIVAIPSQTGPQIQQDLIDHCETMRYRFAVLDSVREPNDTLSGVQDQRQQFDTKYAALYYPWLSIPDPYPTNLANIQEYAIPPSGHVIGVYARTDIERGVHKAPANEVVRGIVGLRRKVNKEQQDILNPYPVNINVIRDFRDNNRGIRIYGGRCITSDSDWKYVNVRRLLIFIEHSIERGLQWVVFEPNAEPLWARVARSVRNFLTVIWRNGALEGTKVEEAFFVKCDRTTMTQTDIDSGRLIVQIGVAPVKPAEFVIVRIGLWTARSDS